MATNETLIAMLHDVLNQQTKTICDALVELERVRINGAAVMGYTEALRADSSDATGSVVSGVSESVGRANDSLDLGDEL